MLAALQADGPVVVFDARPRSLIGPCSPTCWRRGADWAADQIVGADVVRARGGKVVRVPAGAGAVDHRLVERSRAGGAEKPAGRRLRR